MHTNIYTRVLRVLVSSIRVLFLSLRAFTIHLVSFLQVLFLYLKKKVIALSLFFEQQKNVLVKFFMMKRGRYNRPFLHLTAMAVLGTGVIMAPFLADTFPIFSSSNPSAKLVVQQVQAQSIVVDNNVFQTDVSTARDKIITYTVQKGDTLSTIAKKFDISTDTIRWANDLTDDDLAIGDELKILPVTGIAHKVLKGESVFSIAKKYDTNPQEIVDFPFNDFANPQVFSLVEGQILIVPNGVKPSEQPTYQRQRYIATGPIEVAPSGFAWPMQGIISQFFAWYHKGIDITNPVGTPVVAAANGRVSEVYNSGWNGGYGIHVIIDGPSGDSTLYAHLSGTNVSSGETVTAGKSVIGWVGMTGRTTGSHLHFEIRTAGGGFLNPLSVLGK